MGLVPKESKALQTGYENVIEIKGKYQGQLWDKARKKQRAVPGLHDTQLEAALALARAKQMLTESLEDGERLFLHLRSERVVSGRSMRCLLQWRSQWMPCRRACLLLPLSRSVSGFRRRWRRRW